MPEQRRPQESRRPDDRGAAVNDVALEARVLEQLSSELERASAAMPDVERSCLVALLGVAGSAVAASCEPWLVAFEARSMIVSPARDELAPSFADVLTAVGDAVERCADCRVAVAIRHNAASEHWTVVVTSLESEPLPATEEQST